MSDTFRKKYHHLTDVNKNNVQKTKEQAEVLEEMFQQYQSREMSLAITNLEQTMMWATKAIVLHDEKEQGLNDE